MDGEEVAILSRDIQHLGTTLNELRADFKAFCLTNGERMQALEKHVIEAATRGEAHDKRHDRISTRLGRLEASDLTTVKMIEGLEGSLKKWSAVGGVLGGGSVSAVVQGILRLIS